MVNCAVIKDGVVVNMAIFSSEDDISGFDFSSAGEGSFGVAVEDGSPVTMGWTYKDGVFSPPPQPEPSHAELVQIAEGEKTNLLSAADSVFLEWQTKLLLNIASDDEKSAVIAWVNYKDAVRSVDTQQAPNITWPEQPPIPENAQ